VLFIRACCRDVRPDRATASTLFAQAQQAGIAGDDRVAAARALAELFLADGPADLAAACDRVGGLPRGRTGWGPVMRACVTFLLGWPELRLRRGPARAVDHLRTAERACRTCGQEVVRRRATVNLALALALQGALREARRVLDPVISDGRGLAEWTSADAGVEWLTDEVRRLLDQRPGARAAQPADRRRLHGRPAVVRRAGLRVFGVFTAVAAAGAGRARGCRGELRAIAEGPALGVAWHVYQRVARAMLDLDAGRTEQARAAVRDAGT
jgi:LuxR family maltose regulon positive regulatory protein